MRAPLQCRAASLPEGCLYNAGVTTTEEALLPAESADQLELRHASLEDAALIQTLYGLTPGYFEIISIPLPSLSETQVELGLAVNDERRSVALLTTDREPMPGWQLRDAVSGRHAVGIIDYKLDYPGTGDATVNLILIPGVLQGRGIGSQAVRMLEARLSGRCTRLLAAIYGQNRRAEKFWKALGYHFAIDAKPNLDWYAKELPAADAPAPEKSGTAE